MNQLSFDFAKKKETIWKETKKPELLVIPIPELGGVLRELSPEDIEDLSKKIREKKKLRQG